MAAFICVAVEEEGGHTAACSREVMVAQWTRTHILLKAVDRRGALAALPDLSVAGRLVFLYTLLNQRQQMKQSCIARNPTPTKRAPC